MQSNVEASLARSARSIDGRRTMIRRLKHWFKRGPEVNRAREVALQACIEKHPTDKPSSTELRAVEDDRFVVAVLIEPPSSYRGMPRYRLYSISRDFSAVEELPKEPDSPYVFRGIK